MSLASFLVGLTGEGQVRVTAESAVDDEAGLDPVLCRLDEVARLEAPATAPPLDLDVARWAARVFYRACLYVADRSTSVDAIERGLGEPCPGEPAASTLYSADLMLRYLPDLLQMARLVAPGDFLCARLAALAGAWPLSSVGVSDLAVVVPDALANDASLRRLYADRILARRDASRLGPPWVDELCRAALGQYPALQPAMASALAQVAAAVPRANRGGDHG